MNRDLLKAVRIKSHRRRVQLVYVCGAVVALATSPLYQYFGTTAMGQRTVSLSTDMTHVPLRATIDFVDVSETESFQYCGWDVVFDLDGLIPIDSEVVIWGLSDAWDQDAFDGAYADALNVVGDNEGLNDDTAEPTDTGVQDTAFGETGNTTIESEAYARLDSEHQIFYDTMRTFSNDKFAYRITDNGTVNGPLFEEYASIVVQDSIRILYYSECGNIVDHFVLTILGQSLDVDATVVMVAHQGEQVAQPVACSPKTDNPDYSNVYAQVTVQ